RTDLAIAKNFALEALLSDSTPAELREGTAFQKFITSPRGRKTLVSRATSDLPLGEAYEYIRSTGYSNQQELRNDYIAGLAREDPYFAVEAALRGEIDVNVVREVLKRGASPLLEGFEERLEAKRANAEELNERFQSRDLDQ